MSHAFIHAAYMAIRHDLHVNGGGSAELIMASGPCVIINGTDPCPGQVRHGGFGPNVEVPLQRAHVEGTADGGILHAGVIEYRDATLDTSVLYDVSVAMRWHPLAGWIPASSPTYRPRSYE